MSDAPETLAAIVEEMRDERIIRLDGADTTRCLLLNLADRIEAAATQTRADLDAAHNAIASLEEELERLRAPGNAAVRCDYGMAFRHGEGRREGMKIERGKIVEATEQELFEFYLTRGWDDIMDFRAYLEGCENAGTKIIKEGGDHA